jgi:shikimate kinase
MRIYLTGYMASGKTTIGKEIAERLGYAFTDLDDSIEQAAGRSISAIFEQEGEPAFRLLEEIALKETAALENVVIACGGGTPCWYDNMQQMNTTGLTIWINTSGELIVERLLAARLQRPLVAALTDAQLAAHVHTQLQQRLPFYQQAQVEHQPHAETIEQLVLRITKIIYK